MCMMLVLINEKKQKIMGHWRLCKSFMGSIQVSCSQHQFLSSGKICLHHLQLRLPSGTIKQCYGTVSHLSKMTRQVPVRIVSTPIASTALRGRCPQVLRAPVTFGRVVARRSATNTVTDTATQGSWRVTGGDLPAGARRAVGWWLVGCAGAVWGAVLVGGLTRLTEAGLSMVSWHAIKDMRPPRSEAEWLAEFDKYKCFPEFQQRDDMTLSEFKFIFYMEFAHRMWGRGVGVVFLLPAAYFLRRGWISRAMKPRLAAMAALIGFQGFMGWYMVRSGLHLEDPQQVARVSPYRLAAHLGTAFVLYTLMLWSALGHLAPPPTVDITQPAVKRLRRLVHPAKGLVFVTAITGAFVAGLDAGLIYNTFPKMGDRWVPSDLWALESSWKNFTENPAGAQFLHRILGVSSAGLVTAVWLASRKASLAPRPRLAANCFMLATCLQVVLGISTLLHNVPMSLAASHQSGALLTLSTAIWLTHELRRIPK